MPSLLDAWFYEPDLRAHGGSFWRTDDGRRVRATRVGTGWALPDGTVHLGRVWSDTYEWDVDHVDPDLVFPPELGARFRDEYARLYGRHDYEGPVGTRGPS